VVLSIHNFLAFYPCFCAVRKKPHALCLFSQVTQHLETASKLSLGNIFLLLVLVEQEGSPLSNRRPYSGSMATQFQRAVGSFCSFLDLASWERLKHRVPEPGPIPDKPCPPHHLLPQSCFKSGIVTAMQNLPVPDILYSLCFI